MENQYHKITSYHDLDIYQRSYNASIALMTKILPALPDRERYDLCNQLSRSCKAVPRLIAEGYAKKHQKLVSKNILMMPWRKRMKQW
jgi:hypothetical protein